MRTLPGSTVLTSANELARTRALRSLPANWGSNIESLNGALTSANDLARIRALRPLSIAFSDVADMAENLKVFKPSLAAFAPRNYMINVESGTSARLRAAQLAPSTITH